MAPRAYSITTRIKTVKTLLQSVFAEYLREHIPLQQGLRRHGLVVSCHCFKILREHIPLQQGLRQLLTLP